MSNKQTVVKNNKTTKNKNLSTTKNKKKSSSKLETSKQKITNVKIPKTVQQSIPYRNVYQNGIIETEEGIFSKSYPLADVTFKIATQEDQENIFLAYGDLLNTFTPDVHAQISVYKRSINKEDFKKGVLIKPKKDGFEKFRNEYNEMLLNKIDKGQNNLIDEKYITISFRADDIESAERRFNQFDTLISKAVSRIKSSNSMVKTKTKPLTIEERMEILYNIYNKDAKIKFTDKIGINGKDVKFFDLRKMAMQDMTSKDLIGPEGLYFDSSYFMTGDTYGRTLFIDNYPASMNCEIISDLIDNPCNMLISVHMDSLEQQRALKLLKNQMLNINANVSKAQQKASKGGYGFDVISPELQKAQAEAKSLLQDVTSRNQKLFFVTVLITHFADTKEQLDEDTESLQNSIAKYLCQGKILKYQQEIGFNSSLPLGMNYTEVKRLLTTESASVFIPYSSEELTQKGGMYYGLNAVSQNMILYNRLNSQNQNGVIFGVPGSGKSFASKREMVNVFLNTEDDIIVIDPENEYSPLAKAFNGEVIRIAPKSDVHLNLFDLDIAKADSSDDDPIAQKVDFISSLCEIAIGGNIGLSPIEKSIIDRCVVQIYQPYLEHMDSIKDTGITCDKEACPTFYDFYDLLFEQDQPEAQNIAVALERFITGTLDSFAHRSNVNVDNRFIVYNLRDVGSQMKEISIHVALNDAWNRIIHNREKGKRTWLYIDEFHIFADSDSSANYIKRIYKRARKFGGVPTGMTQNIEDLFRNADTRAVINNCAFVLMLNQSPTDRAELAQMFHISSSQQEYITNADSGCGLLYNGKSMIPFKDDFPTDTELYKIMTTKMDDDETV